MKKLHELPHEELERIFFSAPFIANLGIRLVGIAPGMCETQLDIGPRHLQQNGFVHAGVQATMADHTAGGAAATLAEPNRVVLSIEFKINLLRAARGERLTCTSTVLKPGSQVMVVESEILCHQGDKSKLVSKTTVSLAIVDAN